MQKLDFKFPSSQQSIPILALSCSILSLLLHFFLGFSFQLVNHCYHLWELIQDPFFLGKSDVVELVVFVSDIDCGEGLVYLGGSQHVDVLDEALDLMGLGNVIFCAVYIKIRDTELSFTF